MSISKEQWKAIEAELKGSWVRMEFTLNGHKISVLRERKSESTTVLTVYIDDFIKGIWMKCLHEIDQEDELMNGVVKLVWFNKFKATYSKNRIAELEKLKRKISAESFKSVFGSDFKTQGVTYLSPHFGSSTTLVRQFKKIEGLALVSELEEVAA